MSCVKSIVIALFFFVLSSEFFAAQRDGLWQSHSPRQELSPEIPK